MTDFLCSSHLFLLHFHESHAKQNRSGIVGAKWSRTLGNNGRRRNRCCWGTALLHSRPCMSCSTPPDNKSENVLFAMLRGSFLIRKSCVCIISFSYFIHMHSLSTISGTPPLIKHSLFRYSSGASCSRMRRFWMSLTLHISWINITTSVVHSQRYKKT